MGIEIEKQEVITYALKMDQEYKKSLEDWLRWAFVVWQQIQYHPQLQDEIFHGAEGSDKAPFTGNLNHDKLLLIVMSLKRADKQTEDKGSE